MDTPPRTSSPNPIEAMVHYKWIILAVIILLWYLAAREDYRSGGYLTGLGCAFSSLLAIIAILVWYIIFF